MGCCDWFFFNVLNLKNINYLVIDFRVYVGLKVFVFSFIEILCFLILDLYVSIGDNLMVVMIILKILGIINKVCFSCIDKWLIWKVW